ncbi:hypothetical protein HDC29_003281 [Sphingopyxis sp. JAI108]|nr:hypothetical protein [Sphingopyxis sp. JAI108]
MSPNPVGDIGYTRDDVESPVFLRASGRTSPALVAPTNRKFDADAWAAALDENANVRDVDLVIGALLIGPLKNQLQRDLITGIFGAISRTTVIHLAVAAANRAVLLTQRALRKANAKDAAGNEVGDFMALSQTKFKPSTSAPALSFDDANTAIIDTLPHWFAQANGQPADRAPGFVDYRRVAAKAEAALSYERLFRDIWQEILWEPWQLRRRGAENELSLVPKNASLQAKWRAWDWRDQMLLMQGPTLDGHFRATVGTAEAPPFEKTIVRARRSGGRALLRAGPLTDRARVDALTRGELLDNSYLAPFLDEPFPGSGLTVRLLEQAIVILQEACRLLLLDEKRVELDRYEDVARFACALNCRSLGETFADCLSITADLASELVTCLTSDPAQLGPLFDKGVWHRPLVAAGNDDLLLVAGAILHGSPLRRASLWLKDAGLGDRLSTTTQGLRFEADVRASVAADLLANPIFEGLERKVARLDRTGDVGEEVDMIIRVGNNVILCEIKSFLCPSEALDRHNYLDKLRGACAQASRKVAWFRSNGAAQVAAFGTELSDDIVVHPLVVVNQSAGTSLQYEGVPVMDSNYLSLLLGDGSFVRGSILRRGDPQPQLIREALFADAAAFSEALPTLLRENPTMKRLEAAIRWEYQSIRVPGFILHLAVPNMDIEAFKSTGIDGVAIENLGSYSYCPRSVNSVQIDQYLASKPRRPQPNA